MMCDNTVLRISDDIQKKLDELSLISYVTIKNSFSGLYMTEQLRVWICEVEIRIAEGNHFVKFASTEQSLANAIEITYTEVVNYIQDHEDLRKFWVGNG